MPAPCAVAKEHGGTFPSDEKALLALPGIGAYTAAAIASIAFGQEGDADRRQYRARDRAAVRGGRRVARRKAAHPRLRGNAHARHTRRRFRASHDGSRRDALHAETPGLLALSLERALRGAQARRCGDLSAQGAEGRRQVAARRGVCRVARRRRHSRAHATRERSARRHDRSADHGMEQWFRHSRGRVGRAASPRNGKNFPAW